MTVPYVSGSGDEQPNPSSQHFLLPTRPPKKSNKKLWIILSIAGALLLLCLCGGIFSAAGSEKVDKVPSQPLVGTTGSKVPSPKPSKTVKPSPTVKPKAVEYSKISDRTWKKIAKNPDLYRGRTYVVYGSVTQFDSATGETSLLADVSGTNKSENFFYDSNTMLSGGKLVSADLVEGDEFQAKVTVIGSYSYDTQIGGNTTVPLLQVNSIKRIG